MPGSIVECENQVLGESLPITGTPFSLNYRSSRVPGRKSNQMLISVSGATLSASLEGIDLVVEIGGKHIEQRLAQTPNKKVLFEWDGIDGYGRPLLGAQIATVKIGYVYRAVYASPSALQASFAQFSGIPLVANPARSEISIWQVRHKQLVSQPEQKGAELGAWSLDKVHKYDSVNKIFYFGDGSQQSASGMLAANIVTTVAGTGNLGSAGDGGSATLAEFNGPRNLTFDKAGNLFVTEIGNHRIRKISLDGNVTTIAGTGVQGFSGDGGPATQANLNNPSEVKVADDGSIFFVDTNNVRIRKIDPAGIISTVAGNGTSTQPLK
jgi:hypothetical protein